MSVDQVEDPVLKRPGVPVAECPPLEYLHAVVLALDQCVRDREAPVVGHLTSPTGQGARRACERSEL